MLLEALLRDPSCIVTTCLRPTARRVPVRAIQSCGRTSQNEKRFSVRRQGIVAIELGPLEASRYQNVNQSVVLNLGCDYMKVLKPILVCIRTSPDP
jgi:hypothetical protein